MSNSLSVRPPRRCWGWGNATDELSPAERTLIGGTMAQLGAGGATQPAPPRESEFALPAPRITPPDTLAACFPVTPIDRLCHSYRKSFADAVRIWMRHVPNPPDWVAFPPDEQAVTDILDWAGRQNVTVVPLGGGTGVCGVLSGGPARSDRSSAGSRCAVRP
jgi:alkyldihydroxyacetonephosphate synthase